MTWPSCSVDAVYSRFGVMFFADPIQAFGNIRRILSPDGRIGFTCWRSMRENELDSHPTDAAGLISSSAAAHFSFDQPCFIEEVLQGAGFARIAIEPLDADASCGDVEATLKVVTQVGALGKLLREAPNLRATVEPQVRAALEKRECDGRVHLKAATWIVTASMAQR